MKRYALLWITILISVWFANAEAIPAFARKHQAVCSTCHSSWPALNSIGRAYKENGYRMTRNDDPGFMNWDKTVPVSGMIKSRPYEESSGSGNRTQRALHEVEVMIAGSMAKNFSGFFELESEDDEGTFNTAVRGAVIGYHPTDAVNVQVSWAGVTWSDPYDVYSDTRKLTRNRPGVIDQRFGGADNHGRLRDTRQNISVYGRPLPQLFYSVGLSGVTGDPLGGDGDLISGRLAYDVLPNLMIGAIGMSGTCVAGASDFINTFSATDKSTTTVSRCASDRSFSRYGLDFQGEFGSAIIQGAYLTAKDDTNTIDSANNVIPQTEDSNDAVYLEARYIISNNDRPVWVPLVRYNRYESNDGQVKTNEYGAAIGYYVTENARAFIEYMDQLAGGDTANTQKVTLQFEIAL